MRSSAWVIAVLLVSASLGACSGDGDTESSDDGGAASSRCSVFPLEPALTDSAPLASTRTGDIERLTREAFETDDLKAESPPTDAEWDLVVSGRIGVSPEECSAHYGLGDLTLFDVIVRGSDPDESQWVVLIQTTEDLEDVDRVALNGQLIELSR